MTTNIAINRGSEWRKWDLHVNTPETKLNNQYNAESNVWREFCERIEKSDVDVFGITDYFSLENYTKFINEFLQIYPNSTKVFFPNIEFRIADKNKDGEHIQFHIIFSNQEEIVNKIPQFLTRLPLISTDDINLTKKYCCKEDLEKIGYRKAMVRFEETISTLEENFSLHNYIIVGLSSGYGSLRPGKDDTKGGEYAKEIDKKCGVFFGSSKDTDFYLNKIPGRDSFNLPPKPVFNGSDSHSFAHIDNKLGKKYEKKDGKGSICDYSEITWVKAEPTFEGLRQTIYEPEERVKIQENKPEEKSGYQVIDRIEIYHQDFQEKREEKENEETIEKKEEFKTIFLNPNLNTIIGGRSTGKSILLGTIAKKLNSDKEVKLDNPEYSQYIDEIVSSMKIFWKDGDENSTRDIEYFPQSYMYQLAKDSNKLNKLVENIIIQDANKKTKIEVYQSFSSDNNSKIIEDINKLFKAKSTIDSIQKSMTEIGDKEGVTKEKEKLSTELESLKAKIQITSNELISYSNLKNEYDKNISSIREIEQQKISLSALKSLSIINDISLNLIDLTEDIRDQVNRVYLDLKQRYSEEWNEQIETILEQKETEIVRIKERNESIEKDELYLKGKSVIDSNQQYKEKEEKYKIENSKLEKITELEKQRDEYDNFINSLKSSIIENSKKYYTELQRIQNELSVSSGRLKITATINTDFPKYKNILYSSINQQGVQGKQIIEKSINTTQELFEDISSMFELLLSNSITLKGGYDNQKLIKELLGTNFFNISYEIEYDTDKFKAMSEGKKAFIILMLLLDFSKKECPILIDQPEDDLDNRAIYNELVTYIKSKKKERQIIIVTHNSNIVIGADSELVIVSNQQGVNSPNKNNRKFDYIFGSIEASMEKDNTISEILYSQGIRQHICEILEGGETAFKNREKKYGF